MGRGGGGSGWGGQGRCEQRSEVFVKIQKKIYIFFFLGGGGVRSGGEGRGGSEVFVKISRKNGGVMSGGRVGWSGWM